MSLRDEFLKAAAVPYKDVEVNGVAVRVNGMSADMQLKLADAGDMSAGDITFWVLEQCLRDPVTADRLFEDGDEALRALSGDVLADLANTAMQMSGVLETVKN